jgi:hypothetical protein
MLRVLKILGLMGLGGVLTLAGIFLFKLEIYIDTLPQAEFGRDSNIATEPAGFRPQPDSFINYSGRYTPSAAPADPQAHLAARRALDAGAIPAQADTLSLAGHRVVDGDGAIISFQDFWGLDEPGQFPPDAGFEKLTIFLAAPFADETGSVELGAAAGAFAFWSNGPANPPWDSACIAYTAEGRIDYRRTRDSYELDLDLNMQPVHAGTGEAEGCKPVYIKQRASAWIGKMEFLNAWDGGGWGRVTIHEAVRENSF